VVDGDVVVYARSLASERIEEIQAEAVLDATPAEVRAVLIDEAYSRTRPHVVEYRVVTRPSPSQVVTYTRLNFPVLDDRDFFLLNQLEEDLAPDGSGRFRASWRVWDQERPARAEVIRVKVNEGYWEVSPEPDGRARVHAFFHFDPGGNVPAWAVEAGQTRVVPETLRGLRDEIAKRRAAATAHAER
jgi:hypothetical protein